MEGKSVFPYQPAGVWSEATFGKKKYVQDKGENLYRRTLYTFWRRIVGPTMLFDTAKRQTCEVKPHRTNTPLQALTLLNDITYLEASRALAELALKSSDDTKERMNFISMRILARVQTQAELEVWRKSLNKARTQFKKHPEAAKEFLSHGEHQVKGLTVSEEELAAWSVLCLNIYNLDETLTKE